MAQLTLGERMSKLFSMIVTSPFFISLVVIAILTIAILIVNAKIKDRLVRIITAIGYTFIIAFIFIQYGSSVITLSDNLFDNIFSTLYFPSLISYICMMLAAVLLLIRTIINNKLSNIMKLTNVSAFIIIVFLFILTLDVIIKNEIDIYSKASIYTNESLVVLIQSSMGIFFIWLILLLIDSVIKIIVSRADKAPTIVEHKSEKLLGSYIKRVFHKKEKENKKKQKEYIPENNPMDELSVLSEEEFYRGFHNYKKRKPYQEYLKKEVKSKEL